MQSVALSLMCLLSVGCGVHVSARTEQESVDPLATLLLALHPPARATRADNRVQIRSARGAVPHMDISAADVVALRKATGAGMMDCKKALVEADGDAEKATEALRAKGMAIANKKGARDTSQGLIKTYVHTGGQLGVMVEVLCETDFVAKNPQFIEFANDMCLQLAADQGVSCVKEDDIDPAYLAEQRRLEMQSETLEGKPDDIKEKIVEGRVQKIVKENALLSRPFVKNPDITVQDHLTKTIATIGENIVVKRFTRMALGEED